MATSFHGNVTVSLYYDIAGGTLGGTLTVAAIDGVATFTDLTLDTAGTGYDAPGEQRQPPRR